MFQIQPDLELKARQRITLDEVLRTFETLDDSVTKYVAQLLTDYPCPDDGKSAKRWVNRQLAKTGAVRADLEQIVRSGNVDEVIRLAETIVTNGWISGVNVAETEALYRSGFNSTMFSRINTVPPKVLALAHEQTVLLSTARSNYVRAGNRLHRQAVAEVANLVVSNTMGSRQATRMVTKRLLDKGTPPFVDRLGRQWGTRNYVGMCVTTVAQRAEVQGKIQTYTALGERFVRVSRNGSTCPVCGPWEGKILVLEGSVTKPASASLSQAQDAGFMHPRCHHTVSLYLQ